MVLIQCPHCEEEIELDDDDAFGEFQCPHCDEEFSYVETDEFEPEEIMHDSDDPSSHNITQNQQSLAVSICGLILGILAIAVFFNAFSLDVLCPEENRSTITQDFGQGDEEVISCDPPGYGGAAIRLFTSCCLMVPGSLFLTSLGHNLRKEKSNFGNLVLPTETTPQEESFSDSKIASIIQALSRYFGIGISAVVVLLGVLLIVLFGIFLFALAGKGSLVFS